MWWTSVLVILIHKAMKRSSIQWLHLEKFSTGGISVSLLRLHFRLLSRFSSLHFSSFLLTVGDHLWSPPILRHLEHLASFLYCRHPEFQVDIALGLMSRWPGSHKAIISEPSARHKIDDHLNISDNNFYVVKTAVQIIMVFMRIGRIRSGSISRLCYYGSHS